MRTLLVIATLFAFGCAHRGRTLLDKTHEVHRAALGFMLRRSASKSAQTEYSAFVVPKEYAKYFSDIRPPVVPNDESRYSTDTGLAVDRVTGKHVVMWSVSQATIDGDTATSYVTWWVGNLGAGGHTVFVRKSRGAWVAERQEMLWISQKPNKAPEPTPGLVTPRALEFAFEVKRRNGNRDAARGAPSPVVAHL